MSREVRGDQHGTTTGYGYGCRCPDCREAVREYQAEWRNRTGYSQYYQRHRSTRREYERAWDAMNRDYARQARRSSETQRQAESLEAATEHWARWGPHEDALLMRVTSNVAAAGALRRTVRGVRERRAKLRKEGLLS